MKKFAYLFKYLQTQKQKQQYYHKRGSEALQRQGCMWLSAALMCVLACPLADTAVTAVTCQQEEKPLPKTVFHKKVLRSPIPTQQLMPSTLFGGPRQD